MRLAALPLLSALVFPLHATAAVRHPNGRDVFVQMCVKCHGRNGEGVKGKYDDPLRGDRSLEKLTKYIERAMPDDHPGKCTGENAAAVARYIYDAFYSREAQARLHPARIELARLTNRQYVTTVADLLKHFTGADSTPGEERGLRATYYNSQHFNDNKKAFERIDRTVDFDFGDASPDKEHGTNEFSIQWRGSLLADETGDYEFILKSPNGVRLWVNDDDEPLIDAWVSSGQMAEHRGTLRLIGGRSYPLKVNCFKFKDKVASISLRWKPPHGTEGIIPARNLATGRSTPTFVIATAFPADDSSVGYERGVSVSKAWDEAETQAAIDTANFVAQKLDGLSHSKPSDTNREAKVKSFCEEFVSTAFRRPLTEDQKSVFITNQFKAGTTIEDCVKRVVLLTLKSPRFLYLGLHPGEPDDFEVAARLSFALWDSIPDKDLGKKAAQGALHTREQVVTEAKQMLADARAHEKMQLFLHHWLQMDRVEPLSKDDKLFPGFTADIIADLRTSLNLFLEEAVWKGAGDYRSLMLSDYMYLNNRLASFYGMQTNAADDFVKVKFSPEERCGVLTHPYLLSAFSYTRYSSPIHRGVFLTRNIVGRALRPPPMAMTFKDADFAPNMTMRQKVAQLTSPQNCQACHSVINPLGFTLEHYDAVGRFRTSENDQPINTVSDYLTEDGQTVRLKGARDVAEFALGSEQSQNAFIEQLFHHVVKQPMAAYGPGVMGRLRRSFLDSEFNLPKLLVEIASISALQGLEKPAGVVTSARAELSK